MVDNLIGTCDGMQPGLHKLRRQLLVSNDLLSHVGRSV